MKQRTRPKPRRLQLAKKTTARKSKPKKAEPVGPLFPGSQVVGTDLSPRYYSNRMGLTTSKVDFALSVQETIGIDEERNVVVSKELARVYISALQAKAVRDLFNRQIAAYEKEYGELPDAPPPPD